MGGKIKGGINSRLYFYLVKSADEIETEILRPSAFLPAPSMNWMPKDWDGVSVIVFSR